MNVYIYAKHNEVLSAWKEHGGGSCNVFSLDYHTDTIVAFTRFIFNHCNDTPPPTCDSLISRYQTGEIKILDVVSMLRNDEHVDFAVKANLIKRFFVVSLGEGTSLKHSSNGSGCNQRAIINYGYFCLPSCKRAPHTEDCKIDVAVKAVDDEFLEGPVKRIGEIDSTFFDNYILDIDLDYFRLQSALKPAKRTVFLRLIREAKCITIALETDCVVEGNLCSRLPITADYALAELKKIIQEASGSVNYVNG